jgi:uncharacterized protein
MTTDPSQSDSLSSTPQSVSAPVNSTAPSPVFRGPDGVRSGWRLLIFFALFLAMSFVLRTVVLHVHFIADRLPDKAHPVTEMTPGLGMFAEGANLVCLLIPVLIMSFIEKKSFADYGLPARGFLGKRFWQGVPYGFALLSLLLVGIAALHGFTLGSIGLGREQALRYAFLYGIVFLLVGLFEEFSFRGYLQATLGSGIGFWPAAIVLSILFGAIHWQNQGEAIFGVVMAGVFGLVASFALLRTGSLWFPIGMHAGWDWAETYFYGVPDSGLLAKGHLYSATFHGPNWLTGGSVGPEGSYFSLLVLLIGALGIQVMFPARKDARNSA